MILFYLISIAPIANLIISPLENQYQPVQIEKLSEKPILVMLTGGGESNILRAQEILRLYYAKPDDQVTILITGTDPLKSKEKIEAEIVKKILLGSGVKAEDIVLETKARTTFESAINVEKLIGQEQFYLVTSGYHLPRAMLVFEKFGLRPIPAPADLKVNKNYNLFSFFPAPGNLVMADLAIHEYFGLLYYKIKIYFN